MKLVYLFLVSWLGYGVAENLFEDEQAGRSSWSMVDDMVLSPLQVNALYNPSREGKNALINEAFRWKDGIVPYEVSSEYDANDQKLIEEILKEEYAKTCVRFRPRIKTDKDYIKVINKEGCWSYIGRVGKDQELSLDKTWCVERRSVAHEFLHALGLYHQHSASNRDDYLTVKWENIEPKFESNFKKYEADSVTDFGEPYDYNSIMHYSEDAFSKNGQPTLVAKKSNVRFGYATSLSPSDINKVNKMYNCKV